uniref:F-box domain-containing protein n=1 Tax=Chromera velia CCMP2878 TaxID=1169474 RepID=A0A0G4FTV9_9ALVE|eukprot:Cvel_18748.t1-p1 / transcript=Cvel_18748.t1 / gene=Cvel_18748 / organism=Chromera_velia_CCMP2878 / gene_product=hypothetical protein / transcript_product=hypothetical protein / location=Cvel_scaffold1572:13190-18973(-) / protein_length=1186 / sequence_SO=supercontig / SO=protein_coding / is_pseudo=false
MLELRDCVIKYTCTFLDFDTLALFRNLCRRLREVCDDDIFFEVALAWPLCSFEAILTEEDPTVSGKVFRLFFHQCQVRRRKWHQDTSTRRWTLNFKIGAKKLTDENDPDVYPCLPPIFLNEGNGAAGDTLAIRMAACLLSAPLIPSELLKGSSVMCVPAYKDPHSGSPYSKPLPDRPHSRASVRIFDGLRVLLGHERYAPKHPQARGGWQPDVVKVDRSAWTSSSSAPKETPQEAEVRRRVRAVRASLLAVADVHSLLGETFHTLSPRSILRLSGRKVLVHNPTVTTLLLLAALVGPTGQVVVSFGPTYPWKVVKPRSLEGRSFAEYLFKSTAHVFACIAAYMGNINLCIGRGGGFRGVSDWSEGEWKGRERGPFSKARFGHASFAEVEVVVVDYPGNMAVPPPVALERYRELQRPLREDDDVPSPLEVPASAPITSALDSRPSSASASSKNTAQPAAAAAAAAPENQGEGGAASVHLHRIGTLGPPGSLEVEERWAVAPPEPPASSPSSSSSNGGRRERESSMDLDGGDDLEGGGGRHPFSEWSSRSVVESLMIPIAMSEAQSTGTLDMDVWTCLPRPSTLEMWTEAADNEGPWQVSQEFYQAWTCARLPSIKHMARTERSHTEECDDLKVMFIVMVVAYCTRTMSLPHAPYAYSVGRPMLGLEQGFLQVPCVGVMQNPPFMPQAGQGGKKSLNNDICTHLEVRKKGDGETARVRLVSERSTVRLPPGACRRGGAREGASSSSSSSSSASASASSSSSCSCAAVRVSKGDRQAEGGGEKESTCDPSPPSRDFTTSTRDSSASSAVSASRYSDRPVSFSSRFPPRGADPASSSSSSCAASSSCRSRGGTKGGKAEGEAEGWSSRSISSRQETAEEAALPIPDDTDTPMNNPDCPPPVSRFTFPSAEAADDTPTDHPSAQSHMNLRNTFIDPPERIEETTQKHTKVSTRPPASHPTSKYKSLVAFCHSRLCKELQTELRRESQKTSRFHKHPQVSPFTDPPESSPSLSFLMRNRQRSSKQQAQPPQQSTSAAADSEDSPVPSRDPVTSQERAKTAGLERWVRSIVMAGSADLLTVVPPQSQSDILSDQLKLLGVGSLGGGGMRGRTRSVTGAGAVDLQSAAALVDFWFWSKRREAARGGGGEGKRGGGGWMMKGDKRRQGPLGPKGGGGESPDGSQAKDGDNTCCIE